MTLTKLKLKILSDIVDNYAIWGGTNRTYRYVLYREWNHELPHAVIIGLNPSAADEEYDDRTVRRCVNFAKRENCGSMSMLNVFALRTTNPKELFTSADPVGEDNDHHIRVECENAIKVIVAWGTHGKLLGRDKQVLRLLSNRQLLCFGINSDGTPKHPLYLRSDTKLVEMKT